MLKLKSSVLALVWLALISVAGNAVAQQHKKLPVVNFLYTSDAHYGLTRHAFRGDTAVPSAKVNEAMIAAMNSLPKLTTPNDGGIAANKKVDHIDYLIQTGDIANRMEVPYQSAGASWKEFTAAYLHHLYVKGGDGKPAQVFLTPGNHDISNAIGYYKPMQPKTDPSAMVGIYNQMMHPKMPLTNDRYDYATQKVNYSKDVQGVHLMFITLWPDSAERIWMDHDLKKVPVSTPVILFTHDQPTCEAVHFTNPVAPFQIVTTDKFENLVAEHYKEGKSVLDKAAGTDTEQRGWVKFLKAHPNIKAYFHGNSNWNEFYVYHGPDNDVNMPVFRVDSPMKGKISAKDETKLSFQLISLDPDTKSLTVRECLWNTDPANANQQVKFGDSKTISLN